MTAFMRRINSRMACKCSSTSFASFLRVSSKNADVAVAVTLTSDAINVLQQRLITVSKEFVGVAKINVNVPVCLFR